MSAPIIELQSLTKRYRRHDALNGLSLKVSAGTAYALLGRNGAGKTTAIHLLMNFLKSDGGSASVFGKPVNKLDAGDRSRIGYVADGMDLPKWMTLQQFIDFLRPMYPTWDDTFCKQLVKLFDLPLDRKLKHLSRGQYMKAAFIGALSYHPRVLILDEPFSGLDLAVREDLLNALFDLMSQEEWTVLLSSHDIDEVERLSDHIGILEQGKLVLAGEKDNLLVNSRNVSLLSETKATTWPKSWWNCQQTGNHITFLSPNDSDAGLRQKIAQQFPDARSVEISSANLKSFYLAQLRHTETTA
jgi:ABC-2 type transport system ATP-binding protein